MITQVAQGSSATFTSAVKDTLFIVSAPGGSIGVVTGNASAQIGPSQTVRTFGPFDPGQAITIAMQIGSALVEYGDSNPGTTSGDGLTAAQVATGATGVVGASAQGTPFAPSGAGLIMGTHVRAALLGDSLTSRHLDAAWPAIASTGLGHWTWANQLVGSPFLFTVNLGISGDVTRSILARANLIPSNVQLVFLTTGTNDVLNMSAAAVQGTIDTTFTNVSGYITAGIANLLAANKRVIISTIPPNNALTPSTDSRIQLLDRLNAFIATLGVPGKVWVVDAFAAAWDATQPTIRAFKSFAVNSDGTHFTSAGSQAIGIAAMSALKLAYAACAPDIDIYADYLPVRTLYSQFRNSTGGTAGVISNGSGTLADGWRSINNAGTPTFTLATSAYSAGTDFIGEWATSPPSIDSYFQTFAVSSAAANDNPRIRLPANTDLSNSGLNLGDQILGGSEYFMEIEVLIQSPVNLREVTLSLTAAFTAGTSPADQPYAGTTFASAKVGSAMSLSSSSFALQSGYRAVLRTPVLRVPENYNTTAALQLTPAADIVFLGAGSATVSFARPRIWHRPTGHWM